MTVAGTFTAHDKAFDNTTAATINTNSLTLVGKVGADVVTLTPTLVFSDAAVGAGKTVSLTGSSIGGADAYELHAFLGWCPDDHGDDHLGRGDDHRNVYGQRQDLRRNNIGDHQYQ